MSYAHHAHAQRPLPYYRDSIAQQTEGESFVKNGRTYYWILRDGRRVYTSHPFPGMTPAVGPGSSAPVPLMGASTLDSGPAGYESPAQHAARLKALARLQAIEQRVSIDRRIAKRRILRRAAKLRKAPKGSLR